MIRSIYHRVCRDIQYYNITELTNRHERNSLWRNIKSAVESWINLSTGHEMWILKQCRRWEGKSAPRVSLFRSCYCYYRVINYQIIDRLLMSFVRTSVLLNKIELKVSQALMDLRTGHFSSLICLLDTRLEFCPFAASANNLCSTPSVT